MFLVDWIISPLSVINLDVFGAISVDCMTSDFNFYHRLYFTFAFPIVATVNSTYDHMYCMNYA